jgi:anti-anti-sigma factor
MYVGRERARLGARHHRHDLGYSLRVDHISALPQRSLFHSNPQPQALISPAAEIVATNAAWQSLAVGVGLELTPAALTAIQEACTRSRSLAMRASCELVASSGDRLICHVWPADDDHLWAYLEQPSTRPFELLRELINRCPINVYAVDAKGICVLSEGGLLYAMGLQPGANVGTDVLAISAPVPDLLAAFETALAGHEPPVVEFPMLDRIVSQVTLPRFDAGGAVTGAFCIVTDVTARRRDEELLREQSNVIQDQRTAISQLSTPIIEVWDSVLAAPLVGTVDSERAMALMESLLQAITRKRSRFAILDLTGVDAMESSSAAHLVSVIHSVRLLGAEALVTGIRPEIAQTMVELGLDLSRIPTLRSLRDALARCAATGRPR